MSATNELNAQQMQGVVTAIEMLFSKVSDASLIPYSPDDALSVINQEIVGLSQPLSTLTDYADALQNDLNDALDSISIPDASTLDEFADRLEQTITSYSNFVVNTIHHQIEQLQDREIVWFTVDLGQSKTLNDYVLDLSSVEHLGSSEIALDVDGTIEGIV